MRMADIEVGEEYLISRFNNDIIRGRVERKGFRRQVYDRDSRWPRKYEGIKEDGVEVTVLITPLTLYHGTGKSLVVPSSQVVEPWSQAETRLLAEREEVERKEKAKKEKHAQFAEMVEYISSVTGAELEARGMMLIGSAEAVEKLWGWVFQRERS